MWEGDAVCAIDTKAETRLTRRSVIGVHRPGVGCVNQSRSLEAVPDGCSSLGRAPLWAHRAEQAGAAQEKVREALEIAKQMAD
jgi:hypothetical protein